jgi:aspartate/methionine/tyrosine aminotransferase
VIRPVFEAGPAKYRSPDRTLYHRVVNMDSMTPRARAAVQALPASRIREVANSAMGRRDVLAFWFGEPAEVTDSRIRDAATAALAAGDTFYHPNLGTAELRAAIADYSSRLHGKVAPGRIAVTSSGVAALMLAVQTLVGPGDRVVIVSPVWPNLPAMPALMGAEVIRVSLRVDEGSRRWRLDLDELLAALTPGTRVLMINSPGNPTGWVAEDAQVRAILSHCRRQGTWVLSDEAYERLAFGMRCAPSFLDHAGADDRLVVANTFSKTWQMTGWRLGWLTLPQALVPDVEKLIEFNTSCAPGFVQQAGLAAIALGEEPIRRFAALVAEGTAALAGALEAIPRVAMVRPDGAMYLLLRIDGCDNSLALARRLVEQAGLGLAPGVAFGDDCAPWLRWCTARAPEQLLEGARRLERFVAR